MSLATATSATMLASTTFERTLPEDANDVPDGYGLSRYFDYVFFDEETVVAPTWLRQRDLVRIQRILTTAVMSPDAVHIDDVPADAAWGLDTPVRSVLCSGPNAIRICTAALVRNVTTTRGRYRFMEIEVELELLRDCDHNAMGNLLQMVTPPPDPKSTPAHLLAALPLTPIHTYPLCFDATAQLRPKSRMDRFDFDEVNENDIVLVELWLVREKQDGGDMVRFLLEDMALLVRAPK